LLAGKYDSGDVKVASNACRVTPEGPNKGPIHLHLLSRYSAAAARQ
jgi:hypothetical protein